MELQHTFDGGNVHIQADTLHYRSVLELCTSAPQGSFLPFSPLSLFFYSDFSERS